MPYTRKQVVTCISIVFLLLVTGLAGYASSEAERFSIPIPNALTYATTLLPIISGLLLESGYDLTRVYERRQRLPRGNTTRPRLIIVANTLIFIYSTVVITLLGTHAAPQPLAAHDCALREHWTALYRNKDVESIRKIQQVFQCCGFRNSRDMAWPFPDKTHLVTACETTFGHLNGCLQAWRGEEKRVAGILMAVVGLVFVWQGGIIVGAVAGRNEAWLHRIVPDGVSRFLAGGQGVGDEERAGGGSGVGSRNIGRLLPQSSYSDRIQEELSDDDAFGQEGEGDGGRSAARRAIEGGTQRVGNAFTDGDDGERNRGSEENAWLSSYD